MKFSSHRFPRLEGGYTLVEALIVVAIVGLISLVSIPSFISISRSNKLKTSLRQFTNDVRLVRQRAVSKSRNAKLSFATGTGIRSYYIFEQVPGEPWRQADQTRLRRDCPKVPSTAAFFPNGCLDESVSFTGATFDDIDNPADARLDVVFNSSGAITNIKTPPNTVTIRSRYTGLTKQEFVVELGASGSVTSR